MKVELTKQEIRAIIGALESQQVRLGFLQNAQDLIEKLETIKKESDS